MVPFYGQGMNCGLEDMLVFETILDKHIGEKTKPSSLKPDLAKIQKALEEYSATRNPDAEAICDLAMCMHIVFFSAIVYLTPKS
jgi:kynurenine 3-monooxygenase